MEQTYLSEKDPASCQDRGHMPWRRALAIVIHLGSNLCVSLLLVAQCVEVADREICKLAAGVEHHQNSAGWPRLGGERLGSRALQWLASHRTEGVGVPAYRRVL